MRVNSRNLNSSYRALKSIQYEGESLIYEINWSGELDTDSVATSSWSYTSSSAGNIYLLSGTTTHDIVSVRVVGDRGRYRVINKITTTNGDIYERYIDLRIKYSQNNSSYCTGGRTSIAGNAIAGCAIAGLT